MKTHPYTRMCVVACTAVLAACASTPTTVRVPVSASLVRPDTSLSSQVFQGVNSYRRSIGAQELQRHAGLDRLAQEHCEYLRQHRGSFSLNGKNVSHVGFDGRASVARLRYNMDGVSENVVAANYPGQNRASLLISLWKGSKDHHKNMIDAWTYTGVGTVVDSDGMVFSTQLFATPSMPQIAARQRYSQH